jgi:hypothetical protein
MADWRTTRRNREQMSQRHAVLRHSKWASSYIPSHEVPGLAQGEPMDRAKLTKLQANVLHAVTDHAERAAGGREQAHGWTVMTDRAEQHERLAGKGYRFERFGHRPHQVCVVFGQGRPYQPCPDEPNLGGPIGGWKEHSDWLPDRNAPATPLHKHLPPGHKQPWFKEVPKPATKKGKHSVYHNDEESGGWRPGTSLTPWRPKDYLSNHALEAKMTTDLRRTEARLQLTRAGNMYADVLDEENLPYTPPPAPARPSTAPPRVSTRQQEGAQPVLSGFAQALAKRRKREALLAEYAEPKPKPEPEPEPELEPATRPSTAGSSRGPPSRPSTAGSRRPPSVSFATSPASHSPKSPRSSPSPVENNADAAAPGGEAAALAATLLVRTESRLGVESTVADPEKQKEHGYGNERTIWVGNIDGHSADEDIIKEVFELMGGADKHEEVVEDIVIREKGAGKKDWALVTFYDVEHAQLAILEPRMQREKEIFTPDVSKDWKIKLFQPKQIKSNAAHLVQKVNETVTYRHDLQTGHAEQKHARQPKVMMGPRYERPMGSRPQWTDPNAIDENEQRELEATERMGLDANSNAGRLVRTIAAFGAVEDQKNKELKGTLVEHTDLQKELYSAALKTHWASSRAGRGRGGPPSPPGEGPDEPSLLTSPHASSVGGSVSPKAMNNKSGAGEAGVKKGRRNRVTQFGRVQRHGHGAQGVAMAREMVGN